MVARPYPLTYRRLESYVFTNLSLTKTVEVVDDEFLQNQPMKKALGRLIE